MKHKSLFLATFILGVSSLVFASTVWPAKKSAKEINSLLKDEKKELKILKKKIARQEKLLSSVGKKEGKLLDKLKKIDNQIKLKERELKIYQWNSLINKKKLAKLENNLNINKKELKAQKILLGKRFRQIYK